MPRPRTPGRHRRPEPVVAPSNAPSLVLAVPGAPSGSVRSLAEEILSIARSELPGLRAQVGYVEGDGEEFPSLETVLAEESAARSAAVQAADSAHAADAAHAEDGTGPGSAGDAGDTVGPEGSEDGAAEPDGAGAEAGRTASSGGKHAGAAAPDDGAREPQPARQQPQFTDAPDVLVIPLLVGPDPGQMRRIRQSVLSSGAVAELTDVLGPHPLLAEGVHVKLSEAGLARADRARLFTVATAADGIVLAAVGGEEAVQAAGITGMLLAARLAVPVLAAALDADGAVARTAEQLRESGSQQVAIAPCLIGPEVPEGLLEAAAREADCSVSEPLGAYPAVGKLVASTYAAKLGIAKQQAAPGMPVR